MSDRVFELVHSLNQSEKRYFKQFLKRHSDNLTNNIYANFFDYINITKEYNKGHLLKKCEFIKPAQLQNIRSRLYGLILTSLRNFHSNTSTRTSILQMMINSDLLVEKGIDPSRIEVQSKGETEPIATNKTPAGAKKNRRVELQLIKSH